MKPHKTTTIFVAVLTTAMIANRGYATSAPSTVTFRVEAGDTYSKLFGSDWEKAYTQNKVTVIRAGRPLTSPDLLIEGTVVTVSPDVCLTPRAISRISDLRDRQSRIKQRLDAVVPKVYHLREAQGIISESRSLLSSEIHFAADIGFAEREVSYLETLASAKPTVQQPNSSAAAGTYGAVLCVIGALGFLGLMWRRHRAMYPEGSVRYKGALEDVKTVFKANGVEI